MRAVTPEDLLKLRRYLDTVGTRLEELRDAIQERFKRTVAAQQNTEVSAAIAYDEKTTRAPSEPSERSRFYLCYV